MAGRIANQISMTDYDSRKRSNSECTRKETKSVMKVVVRLLSSSIPREFSVFRDRRRHFVGITGVSVVLDDHEWVVSSLSTVRRLDWGFAGPLTRKTIG